jgi:hypothetical protein
MNSRHRAHTALEKHEPETNPIFSDPVSQIGEGPPIEEQGLRFSPKDNAGRNSNRSWRIAEGGITDVGKGNIDVFMAVPVLQHSFP